MRNWHDLVNTSVDDLRSTLACAQAHGQLSGLLREMIDALQYAKNCENHKTRCSLLRRFIKAVPGFKWRCRMCGFVFVKKSPGIPDRRCKNCGCHFEDLAARWKEVL